MPCLRTTRGATPHLVTSCSVELRGKTTKPPLRMMRMLDSPSCIRLLTSKVNTTNNARSPRKGPRTLLFQITTLPPTLPVIPRLRMSRQRRCSLSHNPFTSSPRPLSISSYKQASPVWNTIIITLPKNPIVLPAMDRPLPPPRHLLPGPHSPSVPPTHQPTSSISSRSTRSATARKVILPCATPILPISFVTSTM